MRSEGGLTPEPPKCAPPPPSPTRAGGAGISRVFQTPRLHPTPCSACPQLCPRPAQPSHPLSGALTCRGGRRGAPQKQSQEQREPRAGRPGRGHRLQWGARRAEGRGGRASGRSGHRGGSGPGQPPEPPGRSAQLSPEIALAELRRARAGE